MSERKPLTTAHGVPVADDHNSITAGPRDPALTEDFHLVEKLSRFERGRRAPRAQGSGAYGALEIVGDISGQPDR